MFYLSAKSQYEYMAARMFDCDEESMANEEFVHGLFDSLLDYLEYIPSTFHEDIKNHTLLTNKKLYKQYVKWATPIMERVKESGSIAYEEKLRLSAELGGVLDQSFHDGEIVNTKFENNNITFYMDMSGGFTSAAYMELTFIHARFDGELGRYYIYDEWKKLDDCYGVRILTHGRREYDECTIYFKDINAKMYYRPLAYYEEGLEKVEQFIASLKEQNDQYFLLDNGEMNEVGIDRLDEYSLDALRNYVYSNNFVDRFAIFSVPLEPEWLVSSALGDDLVLKSRAFNTLYEVGCEYKQYVNSILEQIDPKENDDIYYSLLADHFYKLGCLSDNNREKWIK